MRFPSVLSHPNAKFLKWLNPDNAAFNRDNYEGLNIQVRDDEVPTGTMAFYPNVFMLSCFPASCREKFISVRTWTDIGEGVKVGVIEDVLDWPAEQ